MYALDFEYDGRYLSDFGFMICTLGNSSDYDVVSAGSEITFNKVSRHRGKIYSLAGTKYEQCVTATFHICKNTDLNDNLHISKEEYRELMRWLNRNEFLPFRLFDWAYDQQDTCYFNASFNVNKVVVNKELFVLELNMETDKPFGFDAERVITWNIKDPAKSYTFQDSSDEIGYIYPNLKITCNSGGDLQIRNESEDCTTVIKNCSSGEVITIDGHTHIITSSKKEHKLYDDFNFEYFRIGNTARNKSNKITVSLPCKFELRYAPIVKDTPQ